MKLSIIIPVYNVEAYLTRCVDSVLSQDFRDYEIILIDDGSTDGSGAICDAYASEHPCVTVLHKPNGGLSSARNAGLDIAKGQYILFVDSDDFIEAGSLGKIAPLFKNGYDVIRGLCRQIDETGAIVWESETIPSSTYNASTFVKSVLTEQNLIILVMSYFYRKDYLEANKLRFYPGILHEDELWVPLSFLAAKTVYTVDICHYVHTIRNGSIMHSYNRTARAFSTMTVCAQLNNELSHYPRENVTIFLNRMVMLFLRDIPYVQDRQKYIAEFGRLFPLKNATSLRQRCKAFLFATSPALYCRLVKRKNSSKYYID